MKYIQWLVVSVSLALGATTLSATESKKYRSVPLKIDGDTVLVVKTVPFKVVAPDGADDYTWTYPRNLEAVPLDNVLTVTKAPVGEFIIVVKVTKVDFDAKKVIKDFGTVTVVFGGVVPPGPDPDIDPKPDPKDVPIKLDGFAVLMVLESGDQSKLPANQRSIASSQKIRSYLNDKCTTDPSRKDWKAFRMWDKDDNTINEHKVWQDAMSRPRNSIPWIIISNGKTGYEGPLPKTVDDTLTLLKKYGG